MPSSRILNVINMFFNAIRENKILEKNSKFTVCVFLYATCIVSGSGSSMFYKEEEETRSQLETQDIFIDLIRYL